MTLRTVTFVGAVVLGACVRFGTTQERRLVDFNDGPLELRKTVVREYVTPDQLARLRDRAKEHFPGLTAEQLATLALGWQQLTLADGDHIMIVVTYMPQRGPGDAAAVVDYVARSVLEEVRPKLLVAKRNGNRERRAAEQSDEADKP